MRHVDLARWKFDYDLTFAVLLAHPDGTVYHRFGGRDAGGASDWLSMEGLLHAIARGREAHARHVPSTAKRAPPRTIEDNALFAARDAQKRIDCVHCHTLHDFEHHTRVAAGTFERDQVWIYPDAAKVGLELDPVDARIVRAVAPGSAAAEAGVTVADKLLQIGAQRVATRADVQFALHGLDGDGASVELRLEREGTARAATLELAEGWRRGTPASFAWRPSKWPLRPAPGFGGPRLQPDRLEALGLARDAFAFRVQYLVNWGHRRATGQSAARAGLRTGDVVHAVDGRSDFESIDHFHAWVRLEKRVGQKLTVDVFRGGDRARPATLEIPLVDA